jgi:hypothetical protein
LLLELRHDALQAAVLFYDAIDDGGHAGANESAEYTI